MVGITPSSGSGGSAQVENRSELLCLLAELLEYPDGRLAAKARRCERWLAGPLPEAAAELEGLATYLEDERPARLEEVYTATFDLKPQCYPYAGYQLFGEEDPKRSDLMVKLRQSFHAEGFDAGNELPDHVSVLLRFMARVKDRDLAQDLGKWVLVPALQKMAQSLAEKQNPYGKAISAAAAVVGLPWDDEIVGR